METNVCLPKIRQTKSNSQIPKKIKITKGDLKENLNRPCKVMQLVIKNLPQRKT